MSKTIIIACGGSGGHYYPGLSIACVLKDLGHRPILLISDKKFDTRLKRHDDIEYLILKNCGFDILKRNFLIFFFRNILNMISSIQIITRYGPSSILGMGGFSCFHIIVAGIIKKKTCYIHESNARSGSVTRLLGMWVKSVFCGMVSKDFTHGKWKIVDTGTPVRNHAPSGNVIPTNQFMTSSKKVVVIMGGSQGAKSLNEAASFIASFLKDANVIHITGKDPGQNFIPHGNYQPIPYIEDVNALFEEAHVVVTRSGGSTLAELEQFDIPVILVPYPHSKDYHQKHNAQYFLKKRNGVMLEEGPNFQDRLKDLIAGLLNNIQSHETGRTKFKANTSACKIAHLLTGDIT